MNDIRARFEEIWPVPEGVRWESDYMKGNDYYEPDTDHGSSEEHWIKADEWDARLETFTRCQETTAIYSGIVDDMIREMELINDVSTDLRAVGIAREAIGRAKQKMGVMKNGR